MSEPKTLTPGELLAIAHERDWSAHFHDDGYVEIESLGGDALAYERGLLDALCAATSKVLGVPVVVRDETSELKALVREHDRHVGNYWKTGDPAEWGEAMAALREALRLAGDEASEVTPLGPNPLLLLADAIEETIGQAMWGQTLSGRADLDGRDKVMALLGKVRRLASEGES